MNEWLNVIFRWAHLVAGVMWIGHLWFFNFVNAQLAKTYDPDSRKKVLPELMPRALYWFRWGAAYTWVTGILLLFLVYWFGGAMVNPEQTMGPHAAGGIGLVLIIVGFVIYDMLWKAMKNETAGTVISFVLVAVFASGDVHPRRRPVRHDHGGERLDADLAVAAKDHRRSEGHGASGRSVGGCAGGAALEAQHLHEHAAHVHHGLEPLPHALRLGRELDHPDDPHRDRVGSHQAALPEVGHARARAVLMPDFPADLVSCRRARPEDVPCSR